MIKKLHIALFICLLGFQTGCKSEQTSATSLETQPKIQKDITDEEIKQLFLDSGLGEGDGNLEKLNALAKERVVAVVQKIKDETKKNSEDQYIALKSSYFLWQLDVDKAENEKFIADKARVKITEKTHTIKFEAISWLGIVIDSGKKEYLPIVFEATPRADNAFAQYVFGIITNELTNSPKLFLQYLSKEPRKVKKSVYKYVLYTDNRNYTEKGTFEKIVSNVKNLENEEGLEDIVKEFIREVNKPYVTANTSDKKIREIILNEDFYEGDRKYRSIMSLPMKKIVPILEDLRGDGIDEPIFLKSAYLLCKLNVDYTKNVQFLIDEADPPPTSERKNHNKVIAIEYIGELITPENKELLPVVFRVSPKSDAGFTTSINATLYYELSRFSKTFLQYLSKESEVNKTAVIEILSFKMASEKDLKKVRSNLNEFLNDENLGKTAQEILDKL